MAPFSTRKMASDGMGQKNQSSICTTGDGRVIKNSHPDLLVSNVRIFHVGVDFGFNHPSPPGCKCALKAAVGCSQLLRACVPAGRTSRASWICLHHHFVQTGRGCTLQEPL